MKEKIPVIHIDTFEWKGYHYFVRVLEGGEMQFYSHETEKWDTILNLADTQSSL